MKLSQCCGRLRHAKVTVTQSTAVNKVQRSALSTIRDSFAWEYNACGVLPKPNEKRDFYRASAYTDSLTCNIDIAIPSVRLSVCLSVCHVLVFYGNGLT